MEITKGIEIIDLSLFVKKKKLLVISDVHLGVEGEHHRKGVLIPKFHLKELIKHFEYIFSKAKPETILITGDLKHEFGGISEQEWRDILRFFDFLSKHAKKIVLLKGNHDPFLGPIAKKRNLEVVKEYQTGSYLFVHGDYEPTLSKAVKTVFMGHEHPAISLREKTKVEKFKCFLKGKYKGRELIVLPSLNLLTEGTDVLQGVFLSPLLTDQNYEVYVVEKMGVYYFGKLKNLK
jgi:putative SbcD/Mre11-related phosphoesterase